VAAGARVAAFAGVSSARAVAGIALVVLSFKRDELESFMSRSQK
jgi:hypothetical protein